MPNPKYTKEQQEYDEHRQRVISNLRSTLSEDQQNYIDQSFTDYAYIIFYNARKVGKTYALAIYTICWMIDYPGEWITLRDHYQENVTGNHVLESQIKDLFNKYIAEYGYKLETRGVGKNIETRIIDLLQNNENNT